MEKKKKNLEIELPYDPLSFKHAPFLASTVVW